MIRKETKISRRTALGMLSSSVIAGSLGITSIAKAAGKDVVFVTPYLYDVMFYETLVAKSAGIFEKNGLNVVIEPGKTAVQGIQQMLSGQAQTTRTVGLNMMRAVANEGVPMVSIATLVAGPFFQLYSSQKNPIRKASDLVGKTIGVVVRKGATEYTLDLYLRQAGIDPDSVKREIAGDTPASFALIESGRIDGWVGAPPTQFRLTEANLPAFWFQIDNGVPSQILVTKTDLIKNEPDVLIKFLKSIREAALLVAADTNGEQTLKYLGAFDIPSLKQPAVAKAQLTLAKEMLRGDPKTLFRNNPDQWKRATEIMVKAGLMKEAAPEVFYTNTLIDAI